MDDTILTTQRLVLRYQRESDIAFLVDLWIDEDMTKYTGGPREKSFLLREMQKTAAGPRMEEYDLWPVVLKESGEPIGHAGFIPKEIQGQELIELNYYIAKKNWGRGYAKEIAQGLIEYGFRVKKLRKIIAIIDPSNEASKKVAEAGRHGILDLHGTNGKKQEYLSNTEVIDSFADHWSTPPIAESHIPDGVNGFANLRNPVCAPTLGIPWRIWRFFSYNDDKD